jgi:hypothetical protein
MTPKSQGILKAAIRAGVKSINRTDIGGHVASCLATFKKDVIAYTE